MKGFKAFLADYFRNKDYNRRHDGIRGDHLRFGRRSTFHFYFKMIGGGEKRAPRCPACLRLGRARFYGRYHCPTCGAAFLLTASGQPVKSFVEAAAQPFFLLGLVIISPFTWADLERDWLKLAVFTAIAATQLYAAWRDKPLVTGEDPPPPKSTQQEA